jgi:tetratricopeptide (TPR) repeat protein
MNTLLSNIAEEYLKQHKYFEAAKIFEAEAESTNNASHKISLYKKASQTYHEYGSYDDEARCLFQASNFLEDEEKIGCLVSCWKTYVTAIAVFQYDTGFEWKGEAENLHESYAETIQNYYNKAVKALEEAFKVKNVNKDRLLDTLNAECAKRRSEGGWAESECISSIDEAFKRS